MNKDEITMSKEAYYEALNAAQESGKRMGYAQGRQETAREILQRFYNRAKSNKNDFADVNSYEIELMAEEYGIELE